MPDEQPVDLETRVQHRRSSRLPARRPPNAAAVAASGWTPRRAGSPATARAERDRAVGRDVGEAEDAKADEDAERQQREDEADRERADQQRHLARSQAADRRDPAGAAHELALADADDVAIVVEQMQHGLQALAFEQRRSPSRRRSIAPLAAAGRYENAAP